MTVGILEQRATPGTVELRADATGKKIGGYALKYDTLSQNLGGFVETVARTAVEKSLADGLDVLCRFEHESEYLLGRVIAGTLRLTSDDIGLEYEDDLPATDYAANVAALADRGDLRYSSFAFYCLEDDWGFTEQGFPLRTLIAVRLVDVAPVVQPAYMDTSTGLRSLAEKRGIDLDDVTKAAAAGGLAELLRADKPKVIDLAPAGAAADAGQVDNHPALAIRKLRSVLNQRRTF